MLTVEPEDTDEHSNIRPGLRLVKLFERGEFGMGRPVATRTHVNTNKFPFVLEQFAFAKVDGGSVVFQDFKNTAEVGENFGLFSTKNQNVIDD